MTWQGTLEKALLGGGAVEMKDRASGKWSRGLSPAPVKGRLSKEAEGVARAKAASGREW